MKKPLALLLAVLMIFTMMPGVIWAATGVRVSSEQELREAIESATGTKDEPVKIIVDENIEIAEPISYSGKFIQLEGANKNITISPVSGGGITTQKSMFTVGNDSGEAKGTYLDAPKSGLYLKNITIDMKQQGSAIYITEAKVILYSGATIKNGKLTGGTQDGGAMYIAKDSTVDMYTGSVLSDNFARRGGAICIWPNGKFNMYGGTIENNEATGWGGAIWSSGGTIYVEGGTFKGNKTNDYGTLGNNQASGTCYIESKNANDPVRFIDNECTNYRSGIYGNNETTITVKGVYFSNNTANHQNKHGTAITIGSSANLTVEDCTFENSHAPTIYSQSDPTLKGNSFDGAATVILQNKKINLSGANSGTYKISLILNNILEVGRTIIKGTDGYILTEQDLNDINFVCGQNNSNLILMLDKENNEIKTVEAVEVNFNSNDGDSPEVTQQIVPKSVATTLKALEFDRTGYSFVGWNTDKDADSALYTDEQSVALTANTTLYAIWTPNVYNIDYELNGGTAGIGAPATHTYDTYTALVDPTRDGYDFDGWYKDYSFATPQGTSIGATEYTTDVALYAKWNKTVGEATYSVEPLQEKITYTGLQITPEVTVLKDDVATTAGIEIGASISADVGTYTVSVTVAGVEIGTVTFNIVPAKLIATYIGDNIYLGGTPEFKVEVTGFVNGETADSLSSAGFILPTVTTDASVVGSYTLTPEGGGSTENYEFEYVAGTLTISNRPSRPSSKPSAPVEEVPVTTPDAVAPTTSFSDVADNAYYAEAAEYVLEKGLMNGIGHGQFGPNVETNRAMIVTILYRLEGSPAVTGGTSFSDINGDEYYADAVSWAAVNGIVNGYGDIYAPLDELTREQLATILWRYAAYKGYDVSELAELDAFVDDHMISEYAEEALAWANAVGLINGVGNAQLDPQGDAIRAHLAIMLMRFCEDIAN